MSDVIMSDVKAQADDGKIIVGRIAGVYGVKGWVKVFSETDPREGIAQYKPWYLKHENINGGQWREIQIESGRRQGKTVVVKLKGYDDRDESMLLNGSLIGIRPDQLASLNEEEFYWRELVGLRVINQQGIELGLVEGLMETGANDVLVIRHESGQHLIPWALGHYVLNVDLEQGVIEVDWQLEWDQE